MQWKKNPRWRLECDDVIVIGGGGRECPQQISMVARRHPRRNLWKRLSLHPCTSHKRFLGCTFFGSILAATFAFLCGGGAIVTKGIKDDGIDVIPSFDCVSFSSSWEVRRYLTVPTVASSASGGWLGGLVQLFQPPNSPTRTYD